MDAADNVPDSLNSLGERERSEAAYEQPDTNTTKVIGTLTTVFASILLLCGGCYALQMIWQATMAPMIAAQTDAMMERL